MFNNDLFFPAVVSQQNLARVSFYYWTDQKLFYLVITCIQYYQGDCQNKSWFFASISFFLFFFHNKAEKIDNVILEIIIPYVQASEALSLNVAKMC